MGASFSQTEYKGKLTKLNEDFLTLEDSEDLDLFLKSSDDFVNVFTSIGLEDFRSIKDAKADNIVHIVSHAVKVMHEAATQTTVLDNEEQIAKVKGAIHVLNRIFPLLFEEKELFIRCMWREQALFSSQINAITMMEAISILLFKQGFTINPIPYGSSPQYYGIDENLVWRNGISVPAAANHNVYTFDKNRIDLLRLVITILSQPLFYAPDEYLLVLNPFSTYFSNKRSKNCKNLFVSLINVIVSYDVSGYGVPYLSAIDQGGEQEMLVTLAIHLLLILIEYKPPSLDNLNFLIRGGHISLNKVFQYFMMQSGALKAQQQNAQGQYEVDQQLQESIIEDLTSNEFFRLLRVIHGRMNLDPLYEGFSKYFQNIIDTNATYLPQSLNIIPFYQEISILLWRFMTLNTHVFEDFTERADFHQVILLGVIILMDQSKKDPTKSNLMYLTIFLMLTISASRELAMNLNAPFNLSIQLDLVEMKGQANPNTQCYTYADLVFVSVYGLIKNGPRLLKPIYKSIVAILSNLAPYTKSLCKEGCDGLMYLVQVFAKKEFLLEKEDNCKTLGSLMEAINYLIAYHDETNHYLQIQLMKYQSMFDYFDQHVNQIGIERVAPPQQIIQQYAEQAEEQPLESGEKEEVKESEPVAVQEEEAAAAEPEPAQVVEEAQAEPEAIVEEAQAPAEQEAKEPAQAQPDIMASFLNRSNQIQSDHKESESEVAEPKQEDEKESEAEAEVPKQEDEKNVDQDEPLDPAKQVVPEKPILQELNDDQVELEGKVYTRVSLEGKKDDFLLDDKGQVFNMYLKFIAHSKNVEIVKSKAEQVQEVKEENSKEQDDQDAERVSSPVAAAEVPEVSDEKPKAEAENPYAEETQLEGGDDDQNGEDSDEEFQQMEAEPVQQQQPEPVQAQAQQQERPPAQQQQTAQVEEPGRQSVDPRSEKLNDGDKVQTKNINQIASMPQGVSEEQAPAQPASFSLQPRYPEKEWFAEWKKSLNLQNIKACQSHTYNKAMHIRNQMIEQDPSLSSLQIFNIDEDSLLAHLEKFSLKGLLPVMPKILVTTYKGNDSIDTWLISYLWGLIFVFAQEFNVYDHKKFRLFSINTYQGNNQ